ncbi:MAG: hypothetical protein NTX34_03005 [Cytophagales bacterium]|nr:hypothetical protein [Cytophagales bacterium]
MMGQRKSAAPQKKEINASSSSWGIGVNTNTNSGILGGFSFIKSFRNRSFINVDLTNTKDYREFDSPFSYNGKTYVEGKLNYLINFRPEYGRQWALLKQASEGGTSLNGRIATGPTIGIQKPYFVDIVYTEAGGKSISTSVAMAKALDNTYNKSIISGEGSFFSGLSQAKFIPGWHVKTALEFKFETLKQNYLAIETGFIVDYFSQPVEILNQTNPRSVYTTGYVTFFFGKSK